MKKILLGGALILMMTIVMLFGSIVAFADSTNIDPMVSAGNNHSLSLMSDGKVYAWGNNSSGQLGDGSFGSITQSIIPITYNVIAATTPANAIIGANTITANVSNETTRLTIDITPSTNATWQLYSDADCANKMIDKVMTLNVGANIAYIKVTAEDGITTKVYTLTITRNGIVASNVSAKLGEKAKIDFSVLDAKALPYCEFTAVYSDKALEINTTDANNDGIYDAIVVGDYKILSHTPIMVDSQDPTKRMITIAVQYDDNNGYLIDTTQAKLCSINFDVKTTSPIGLTSVEILNNISEQTNCYGVDNEGNLIVFDNPIMGSIDVLPQPVTSIVVNGLSSISIARQQTGYTAQVLPDYVTNKSVNWSVSDTSVASIDANGLLTPITNGTINVLATSVDGSGVVGQITVTITGQAKASLSSITTTSGIMATAFTQNLYNYAIYVSKNATTVSLKPSFASGTLKYNNGMIWANNLSKSIALTGTTTVITLDLTQTNMDPATYTLNVIKAEDGFIESAMELYNGSQKVTSVPLGGGQFSIKKTYLNNFSYSNDTSYIVTVKDNNRLLSVNIVSKTLAAGQVFTFDNLVNIPPGGLYPNIKITEMLWSGTDKLIPHKSANIVSNTIKDQFLGIRTIKNALVVAVPNVTLGATELFCQVDEIWVQSGTNDPIKLKVGTKITAKDFIGQTVDVDYTEDSQTKDLVISRIIALTSNKTYTIDITSIANISADNSFIEYYEKNDDETTKKILFTNSLNTIYNERYATDGLELLKADMASNEALNVNGTLTIVIGTTYTVVKIKSYKTYFVSIYADTTNNTITVDLPAGSTVNPIIAIPVNDTYTNQIVMKKKTGEYYTDLSANPTLAAISRNSLISIAQSKDKKYHEILIAPSAINGIITEETYDYVGKVVTISGKAYPVAKGFEKLYPEIFSNITFDANATYYVDCFGYISWADKISTGNIKNGLLVNATVAGSGISRVATAKFFDIKTKAEFTVTLDSNNIDDLSSDINKLRDKNNKLFNMNISSGNKIKAGYIQEVVDTTISYGSSTVENRSYGATADYSVGYINGKYYFNNATTGMTLTDVITIFNPVSTTADADRKFVIGSLILDVFYTGHHYTVTEYGRVYNYIVVNTLERLLDSSPVYIVKEKCLAKSVGEDLVIGYTLLDFKAGKEKIINILESVSNELGLVKGDVFTYYKTSTKTDVEIEATKNVTIMLKIDKALSTSKTSGYLGNEFATSGNSQDNNTVAQGKKDGFSFLTIYKDKFYNSTYNYSTSYSLQLPIVYANDNCENELYLAQHRSFALADPAKVYLPSNISEFTDTILDIDFASNETLLSTIDNVMLKPTTSNKIFVYNASEIDETKKLVAVIYPEEINSLLDNLRTVKDVKKETQTADLVYTSIQNNYENMVTLKSIYIIKR